MENNIFNDVFQLITKYCNPEDYHKYGRQFEDIVNILTGESKKSGIIYARLSDLSPGKLELLDEFKDDKEIRNKILTDKYKDSKLTEEKFKEMMNKIDNLIKEFEGVNNCTVNNYQTPYIAFTYKENK